MHMLITKYPYLSWLNNWSDMIAMLERCSQEMRITNVIWRPPDTLIMKLNTDGSAMYNPGRIWG